MSNPWHSLYLRADGVTSTAVIADTLLSALTANGYSRYDPFTGGSGTPPNFKIFRKQFVAPMQQGWVRVLGEPDQAVLITLSQSLSFLHAWLDGSGGGWQVLTKGTAADDPAAFMPYLKPGKTPDDLRRAQLGNAPVINVEGETLLPPDVQQLARDHNVNAKQADKLMDRMTSRLFGRLDKNTGGEAGAMHDQARALIGGSGGPDWNSATGRAVRAVADVLALPANWREPSWAAVRDAYQAARMVARNPKASLLPDERDALKAMPDIRDYVAVYVGKPSP